MRIRRLIVKAVILAWTASLVQGAPLREIDLASDTAWELSFDNSGVWRPIKVPAGGWYSDRQNPMIWVGDEDWKPAMKGKRVIEDHVIYRRQIAIPPEAGDKVVKIAFGAVICGAEVRVDGQKAGEHNNSFTAFECDISRWVRPGGTHLLEVVVFHNHHYENEKGEATTPIGFGFNWGKDRGMARFPWGIARSVRLKFYPKVHVQEIFIQPSVTKKELKADLWLDNQTDQDRTVTLNATLQSWNGDRWDYPAFPPVKVALPKGQLTQVRLGPVPWMLGPKSYWWPNIPFREDYKARLHCLNVEIEEGGQEWEPFQQRFGFVEHAEGPYYYTLNGVRVNGIGDATAIVQGSVYDGYCESPAFKPPTGPGTGCEESWKRFMRLGINTYRTHQEPPPEYIMSVADEVGFMLIPETAIRGARQAKGVFPEFRDHITGMIRQSRNHPSVARYSLENELDCNPKYLEWAVSADATRPYVYEQGGFGKVVSGPHHAFVTSHYGMRYFPTPCRDAIYNMGEFAWTNDGLPSFADQGKFMRLNDVAYFAGWSLLNYWPNFFQGMSHDVRGWRANNHPDRKDGVDGWGSPIVRYVQKAMSPYLVLDHEIERINSYTPDWPLGVPTLKPGLETVRTIEVFNNGLFGNQLTLRWCLRWDTPTGVEVGDGVRDLTIEPGFHATERIAFTPPAVDPRPERILYLVMESVKEGQVVFREDRIRFRVSHQPLKVMAKFLKEDNTTGGNWMGKYGKEGCCVAGAQEELPCYAKVNWDSDGVLVTAKTSGRPSALQYFFNNATTGFERIEAMHQRRGRIQVKVDAGEHPRQLAFYCADYGLGLPMLRVMIPEVGFEQTFKDFSHGKYMVFEVQGKVTFTFEGAAITIISGLFWDSVGGSGGAEAKSSTADCGKGHQNGGVGQE